MLKLNKLYGIVNLHLYKLTYYFKYTVKAVFIKQKQHFRLRLVNVMMSYLCT